MPSRPWPIRILSTLLIIAPLTNTLIAAWFWEVPLGLYLSTVFSQSWITVVELLIPLPLAGYCIYRMRTWSYFTAFGILSLVVLRSIQNGLTMNKIYGGWALAIFLVINLLVIGYLLVPRVRKIYFDARLRWWEALPRFSFDQPVLLSDSIGPSCKNIMWVDIVITKAGNDGNIFRYNLHHLVDHHRVELKDLLRCTRE
ncbi:MAG: hypothetical protein EOP04_17450 [Proteobacteria bacterium]|nr:MAG: hypothetical protein EOP04_17450 [Pseudomonadota bacterium]